MSAIHALVRYIPAESPLPYKTHWRYRAGVVIEALDPRRVFSAAPCPVAPEEPATDDPAAVVVEADAADGADDGAATTGDDLLYYTTLELGVEDGGETEEDWPADWADDSEIFDETLPDDGAEDGGEDWGAEVDWPEGWGWTLDRLPTPEETDAAWNGEDLGGLWVPIQTLGGDEDPIYDFEDVADNTDCDADGGEFDFEAWIAENGVPMDGAPGVGVIFYSRGNMPNARGNEVEAAANPVSDPATATGEAAATDAQGPGGAPAPVTFASLSADGLLLGKWRSSVTDEDPSDLPFLN
jgi:hypothetical protein